MDATPALTDLLFRPAALFIMVACWIVLDLIYRFLPESFRDAPTTVRLAPLYPLVVCQLGVWMPGVFREVTGVGERVLLGLILGWASAHFYKLAKQTIYGKDVRIEGFESMCEVCAAKQQPLDPVDPMVRKRQSQVPTKDLKPADVPTASDVVAARDTPPPEAK